MKTKEEIEKMANEFSKDYIKTTNNSILQSSFKLEVGYIKGYKQCQEDMADKETQDKIKEHILNHANNQSPEDRLETELAAKKYTEEDLIKAIAYGQTTKQIDYHNDFINSLNKQD
jgi:hypothetical protein